MKIKFMVDMGVDASSLGEEERKLVEWRPAINRRTGRQKLSPYFPAGTVRETARAAYFVALGVATPEDDEAKAACPQLTEEQRQRLMREYQATALGINAEDRELFYAGVIAGYEQVDGKTAFKPGPNWKTYKAAQDKIKTTKKPTVDI